MGRFSSQLTQYQSNNGDKVPGENKTTTSDIKSDWDNFLNNYLKAGGDGFADPNGEDYKIKNADDHISKDNYENLFDCDLLIIDDLGTELTNSFTNSELFNILNTRLLAGKKTIISTNLSPIQLGEIYTQRIFSRVFDRFRMIKFIGNDLRWDKNN